MKQFVAQCTSNVNPQLAILPKSLHPADLEVVQTLFRHTGVKIVETPIDPETGATCRNAIRKEAEDLGDKLAAIAFPQINNFGNLLKMWTS